MVPLFSPLNDRSCCVWTLLKCNFGDDISEQFEQLLDPTILSNGVAEGNPLLLHGAFRLLTGILNCHGTLVKIGTITMTVTLLDEKSLPTRYRSSCHVIN
jgi:hypothetical protein